MSSDVTFSPLLAAVCAILLLFAAVMLTVQPTSAAELPSARLVR